ncbi:hypothetical protein QBC38DRAFT_117895 [Podospora fimiseda]|uniref:Ecp2 effector protein-like domain-containing protein n=1 Tax=Podospora fimiseda TaxID=252190 RepID=A0AAN6YNE6_9PEZI|nr:hypothetical protein QBC38DRAFT_117895 [Podospora fimiseda]
MKPVTSKLVVLLPLILSLAVPTSANDIITAVDRYNPDDIQCRDQAIRDQGSRASPYVNHCQQLADTLKGSMGGGFHCPMHSKQDSLAQHLSCVVGCTGFDNDANNFYIGQPDVVRWIEESINKYGRDFGDGKQRVGTSIDVECNYENHKANIGIYHCKFELGTDCFTD